MARSAFSLNNPWRRCTWFQSTLDASGSSTC